jgi:hypothetical protein
MRDLSKMFNLPPMSRKQERLALRRIREQIKPKSVALVDQAKNFYMAVGQGISHWSRMEMRLVQIAAKLLKTSEAKAGLVMYSIMNFHVWIQIIDELFVLDGNYPRSLKMWRKIAELLKDENNIRVRLAHFPISQDEERIGDNLGIQAYLRPAKFDVRTKSVKAKPLTMVEIVEFTGRVNEIHEKLISVLQRMSKRKSLR